MNHDFPRFLACLASGLLVLVAAQEASARTGPPEGSSAWLSGQQLLTRPAPALAAALEARERGDRVRAEWLLAEISLRYPVIRDYADHFRAELLLDLERPAEVVALVGATLESHPDSLLAAQLLGLAGRAHARLGAEEDARRIWRRALDASQDPELRARLLLETALSEERSGLGAEAAQTYRVIWHLYPLSDEAERASTRLHELRGQGEAILTANDWRRRGDSLFRARHNPEALEAYERALSLGLSKSQADRVRRRRAQTLFRLRRYPEAVEAFAALPQKDDIPIWHARSLARADRVPEAIAEFERLAEQRRGPNALRARFLAALLLDGRGETERSTRYLESLIRTRASATRLASLWRLGWRAYCEGRHADAIRYIDLLIAEERDPIGGLRSRYWRARALEKLTGDANAQIRAREELAAIAAEYPLTYYGWRARLRLPGVSASAPAPFAESRPNPLPRPPAGERKVLPDQLWRARILLEAGLPELALAELSRASRRVGGLADRLELAQLYRSAGNFSSAQRLVLDPYQEELARAPEATLEELWWHAWPAAFLELVEEATAVPGSVDAALVFSIMREESGFRPKVMSPVGARGLLQIMEPTGRRLAAAVGHEDFSAEHLFEPRTNIRLGTHYLGELTARFGGRLSAAIASYNAGPEVVSEWLEERPDLDDAEWVEEIPYEQTRSYVKRVLRSLQAYQLLY